MSEVTLKQGLLAEKRQSWPRMALFCKRAVGRHVGGLARFIPRRSRATAQFVPLRQPLAHSVLTSQPGRFSGRMGCLESLPRYAPILILEQAITGTVPGSACGKVSIFDGKEQNLFDSQIS